MKILRNLYAWTIRQADSPNATRALFGISFAESSFFPLPPDLVLIPMCVANRKRALYYAAICTLASVLGGIAGYLIGAFLWETVGQPIVQFYGLEENMATIKTWYDTHGTLVILLAGFTPIPYKLFTIASGAFAFPLLPFIILSAISRGARFFIVAGLLYFFGQPIRTFIEKYLEILTIVLSVLLVGGFVAIKYL